MDENNTTYTQVVDKESGEIKYVPNTPPQGKPQEEEVESPLGSRYTQEFKEAVENSDFTPNDKLTSVLTNIIANNKRLRYDKRLETGKLDGRRLTSYKTSKRLFKKKAIKDKNYRFTFLIDTSGSMVDMSGDNEVAPIQMALEAVGRTVRSLETLKIKSSIFGMNNSFRLFKGFDETLDDPSLIKHAHKSLSEGYKSGGQEIVNCGGTSEWVAYEQTVKYLEKHAVPKVTDVVIILSDGEPGGEGEFTQVIIEDGEELVEHEHEKDNVNTLANFWAKQSHILTFGLGINSKAKQVPNNRQIDDINKLPEVMGNLLTELML